METMVVGIMVVGAVVAVSAMNEPVSRSEGFKISQEELVQDALDALAAQPSRDSSRALFGSLLEEYVLKAIAGDKTPLMDYLNRSLPAGSQYNMFLDTGYGRPLPVLDGGIASGESIAGATSFVPKLAYVFIVPEFKRYQGNFHMNVLALPVHNNILLQDEGESVELAVTFTSDSEAKPVTLRSYGQSALRYNDPEGRSWGSVSLYTPTGHGGPGYYLDGSGADLFDHPEPEVDIFGQNVTLGMAYNVTIPIVVEESADHAVSRGAKISVAFPRGWEFTPEKRQWVEHGDDLGNADHWSGFEWNGSLGEGWTISANLNKPLKNESVKLNLSGDYRMLTDPAYPYFQPIVVEMGQGVQGKSTLLLNMAFREDVYSSPERSLPAIDFSRFGGSGEIDESEVLPLVGGLRRDAYLSLPKPIISGTTSSWGLNFANLGEDVTIERIEIRQPEGVPLMSGVDHASGWKHGSWDKKAPGHFIWTPTGDAAVGKGEAAWLGLGVTAGSTSDNHYRNHDYLDLLLHYSPDNTLNAGTNDGWTYTQRAHHLSGDGVYRQLVPPAMNLEGWSGWPNQAPSYWFGAEANQQQRQSLGNGTYDVDATGVFSQLFGDYQGNHVFSNIHLEDPEGTQRQSFEAGERVHVKNDFSAFFSKLSLLREDQDRYPDLDVTKVKMKTSIYTPDVAWTGQPSKIFTESADLALSFGEFQSILPMDLTGNNIKDVLLVNDEGLIYALDGRDGSRLWHHATLKAFHKAILSDVTGDGRNELVAASEDNRIYAYDTSLDVHGGDRLLWSLNVGPSLSDLDGVAPFEITAMEDLTRGTGTQGAPVVALAVSASAGGSKVLILNTTRNAGEWKANVMATHESSTALTDNVAITDLAIVSHPGPEDTRTDRIAVASLNRTVTVLGLPDLETQWITNLPHAPMDLATGDFNQDGWDDIVVGTGLKSTSGKGGDWVYLLPGKTGNLGPDARDFGFLFDEGIRPEAATALPDGRLIVVGDHRLMLEDITGFYDDALAHPPTGCVVTGGELDDLLDDLLEGQRWTNLYLDSSQDPEVLYLISAKGAIVKSSEVCEVPYDTLAWEVEDEGVDADPTEDDERYIALHVNQTENGLELFRMSEEGTIKEKGGFGWLFPYANVCREIDCSIPTKVVEWQVEEREDGGAERFWALVAQEPEAMDGEEPRAYLLSVAPDDEYGDWVWDHHGQWDGVLPTTFRMEADGAIWLGGSLEDGSPWIVHRGPGEEVFEVEYLSGGGSSGPFAGAILDVLPASDGSVWALDEDGQAWRRAAEGTWVSYPTRATGVHEAGVLVEDLGGTVWALLDEYRYLPLTTHRPHAEIQMGNLGVPGNPEQVSVQIESEEGHLGEDGVDSEPITRIQWFVREEGTSKWHEVGRDDSILEGAEGLPSLSELPKRGYEQTLDCPCGTLEFKAVLESRTLTEGDGVRQDAGMSPLLRGTKITLVSDQGYSEADISPQDVAMEGSGAEYSDYLNGIVLEREPPSWGYRGIQATGNPHADGSEYRFVKTADALTGNATGPQVVVVEQGTEHIQWDALAGSTGLPVRGNPATAGNTLDEGSVREVLIGDLTGDGLENAVFLGRFQGGNHAAIVWDGERDALIPVEAATLTPVGVAALTGTDAGRQTLTFAVPFSRTAIVEGQSRDVGHVQSWYGSLGDSEPLPRWGVQPLESQGYTTFSYSIPRNSLFGASVVVSELVFDITMDGETTTQSARLLDRFDILPPGRTQSVPAIYTVEVVAWHDEGQSQTGFDRTALDREREGERRFEIEAEMQAS